MRQDIDLSLTIVNLACMRILFNVSNCLLNHLSISATLKLKTALMEVYHSYYCSMVIEESYDQLKFSYII